MKAQFGTFNIDMRPIETIDVSDKIESYINENVIVIPQGLVYHDAFGDVGGRGKNIYRSRRMTRYITSWQINMWKILKLNSPLLKMILKLFIIFLQAQIQIGGPYFQANYIN